MFTELIKSPLFQGLNESNLEQLIKSIHYNIISFKAEDMIAMAGDKVTAALIIIEGGIRTEVVNESGNSLRIEDFSCSKILAPGFLFGNKNTYPVNVVANKKTRILVIPKASFIDMLSKNPIVLDNFLNILSDKTQFLVGKIKSTFLLSIEGKIAQYLISISDLQQSTEFVLPNSQKWLAEKFGVARPSIARVLSKMDNKGIIAHKGKHIKIIKPIELKKCMTLV